MTPVNFIHQWNNALVALAKDGRPHPSHRALYFALFFKWNQNRFANKFNIYRDEIMELSGIRSSTTYHKCLKDLDKYGFIQYTPSHNVYRGSTIKMKIISKKAREGKSENLPFSNKSNQHKLNGKSSSNNNHLRPTGNEVDSDNPYNEPF